jgi:hypothetical protein
MDCVETYRPMDSNMALCFLCVAGEYIWVHINDELPTCSA